MDVESVGRLIKPPVERVVSGRIFRPARAFLYKLWVKGLVLAFIIWTILMLGFIGIAYLIGTDPSKTPAPQVISEWFGPMNLWTIAMNALWLIPYLMLVPLYFKSIEYSVKAESGETMPEIYVKKGFVTVSRKHVPFRTITNIESRAGPFDRCLRIGNVSIETAGYSGANKTGPEEKLEGVVFYEEVRDFILNELRRFRAPYTVATEVVQPEEMPEQRAAVEDELLVTLREIRDLLRKRESK